jgi:uncharacterized protein
MTAGTHVVTDIATVAPVRVPIHPDLLIGSVSDLSTVRLAGTRCLQCREVAFGAKTGCPNCGRETVERLSLSERGVLWTFTVVRHRPPGDYKGPQPFEPFGLGLVELPEGVRVLSPIICAIDQLRVGLKLTFLPYLRDSDDGREVIAFAFVPDTAPDSHD